MSIERDICKAIEIISAKTVSAANHGSTILATIVECLNPLIGKYTVKYQNNILTAYNNNINTFYDADTMVYVFLKNGLLDEELIILGPAHNNKTNNYYNIFRDVDFDKIQLKDLFQGQLQLSIKNNKIKADILYLNHYVAPSELQNFKFSWYKNTDSDKDNWICINNTYKGMWINGTSEYDISTHSDAFSFKCEAAMDNFTFIQTIDAQG